MTCGPAPTTFRILAAEASWELDLASADGDVALGETLELAQLHRGAADPAALARVIPPPWIARGRGACAWYVLAPPEAGPPALRRLAPCAGALAATAIACHVELIAPAAIAAGRGMIAVLDPGRGELLVLSPGGERVIAALPSRARGPIAFAGRAILVADGRALAALDLVGGGRRELPPAPGAIVGLAAARGAIWAAIEREDKRVSAPAGTRSVVRLDGAGWRDAPLDELAAAGCDTGVIAADDRTACIELPRAGLAPRTVCFDRLGRPAAAPPPAPPALHPQGTIATRAPLDSGIARCRWHRVRIELDLPERTGLAIALATVEMADDAIAERDWQVVEAGPTCDFLIDQPPGRFLVLRLALRGDGARTPRIRRIRLDFPRQAAAARLPGVYREEPIGADFLERFVSLFDAELEDLDRAIERFPALLDPAAAPTEALPWLGTFLDLALDPAWPEATRRALLAEAPALYRHRGTPRALARAIELVTGLAPAIQELGGAARPFGRLGGGARVGEVRLFGRARARVRLGASALGAAPLRSHGDPDRDHAAALGWRIAVQIPGGAGGARGARGAGGAGPTPSTIERLRRLVDAQKPAHVTASVRVGEARTLVGIASAVGIDTRLAGVPPSYLGTNTLLRRRTVLARGPGRGGAGLAVGTSSAVAIQTVLS